MDTNSSGGSPNKGAAGATTIGAIIGCLIVLAVLMGRCGHEPKQPQHPAPASQAQASAAAPAPAQGSQVAAAPAPEPARPSPGPVQIALLTLQQAPADYNDAVRNVGAGRGAGQYDPNDIKFVRTDFVPDGIQEVPVPHVSDLKNFDPKTSAPWMQFRRVGGHDYQVVLQNVTFPDPKGEIVLWCMVDGTHDVIQMTGPDSCKYPTAYAIATTGAEFTAKYSYTPR